MSDFLKQNHYNNHYLHEYSIREMVSSANNKHIRFILNGNIDYHISIDHENNLESFVHTMGDKVSDTKSFPHEEDNDDYPSYIKNKTLQIIDLFEKNEANFPYPQHIAFIGETGENSDFFICHYKSGSNYLEFSTDEYNKLKTEALLKIL